MKKLSLADTHCHLDFAQFDADRAKVIARAWEAGLDRILIPGIDLPTSLAALKLADAHPKIFAAVGVHPNSAATWDVTTCDALKTIARREKTVAIGEIGLDYYRDWTSPALQQQVFQAQLELAAALKLPVVIHIRNASPENRQCIADVIAILQDWQPGSVHPGVIHSYSGNAAEARQLLDLGFFIGITGPVTFKKAIELQELALQLPLERLLIETDAPYLTPQPFRGKRNEPAHVQYVARKIAELRGAPPEVVAAQTTQNAETLFQWGA